MTTIAPAPRLTPSRPSLDLASPSRTPNRFLGRQPILDSDRRLFGYELFYREDKSDHFSGDPELATREIVDHWLMLIPDANQGTAFVNCTRNAIVNGLVTLLAPESTVLEILENIDPDPELVNACLSLKSKGYRMLRLANSALQHHPGVISTIHEALLRVGEDALRRMVTVAMAGAVSGERSSALISMVLIRARFCELIAPHIGEDPAELYLLGMLSLLDALLQTPFPRILQTLPINPAMKLALAGDPSPNGLALALIRSLESCDWPRCEEIQIQLGLAEDAIAAAYTESLHWAATMTGEDSNG